MWIPLITAVTQTPLFNDIILRIYRPTYCVSVGVSGVRFRNVGLFVPLHFSSRKQKVNRENFYSVEHSFLGTFVSVELLFLGRERSKNFHSLEHSLPWNFHSLRRNISRTLVPIVKKRLKAVAIYLTVTCVH